mmetsp:Transcript_33312/g.88460  ORF Transcript_33312/g.88460 Transcript_33312/m.88460 type:complete len:84 (-) Transcript_33312:1049-1300(-)
MKPVERRTRRAPGIRQESACAIPSQDTVDIVTSTLTERLQETEHLQGPATMSFVTMLRHLEHDQAFHDQVQALDMVKAREQSK